MSRYLLVLSRCPLVLKSEASTPTIAIKKQDKGMGNRHIHIRMDWSFVLFKVKSASQPCKTTPDVCGNKQQTSMKALGALTDIVRMDHLY
jgi:hypothetical protein